MAEIASTEDFEIIAEYLERLGVTDLRQRHDATQVNKSAVLRYLVADKLQEALAHPRQPSGSVKRTGRATPEKHRS